MPEKSFLEFAVEVLKDSKEPLSFKELFQKVVERSGLSFSEAELRKHMSNLYTQLTFDGRLVSIDNKWDLKDRHKFEQYYRDTSELDDGDDEIDDEEEKALQKEESGDYSYEEPVESEDASSEFENKKSAEEDY